MNKQKIFKHIGMNLLIFAIYVFNEWIRDQNITLREWLAAGLMMLYLNLIYLPKHWHSKKRFFVSFLIILICSCPIFWYFDPMSWDKWLINPLLVSFIGASMTTLVSVLQNKEEK